MQNLIYDLVISFSGIAVIVFLYYAFKNIFILRKTLNQYLLGGGILILYFTEIIYLRIIFSLSKDSNSGIIPFILFMFGVITIIIGIFYSTKNISRSYGVSWIKILKIAPYKLYRIIGTTVLFLVCIPLWVLIFSVHSFALQLWVECFILVGFTSFIIAERNLYLSMRIGVTRQKDDKRTIFLKEDILIIDVFVTLVNNLLEILKQTVSSRQIKDTLYNYFENKPLIFENFEIQKGYKIELLSVVKNLSRIYEKDRIKTACKVLSGLAYKIMELYGTVTSPVYAHKVLIEKYMVLKEELRFSPIFLDVLKYFPKESLTEEERFAILSKRELEDAVKKRTIDLEREKLFSSNIIETIPDSLLVLDKGLKIVTANQSIDKMFGLDYREVKGWDIDRFFADRAVEIKDKLKKIIDTGGVLKNFEISYKRKTLEVTVRKINLELGELLVIFKDVTERKVLEQQLIQVERFKTMEQLTMGLTHQIKNPLAIIMGYSELISQDEEIEKINKKDILENVSVIQEQVNRASNLVTNLLEFTKRTEMDFKKIDICLLLDKVISLYENMLKQYSIVIKKDYGDSSKLLEVEADESQLMEIFSVIVNNSLESMSKSGKLEVKAGLSDDKLQAEIKIKDTGCGIREQDFDNIFNPFFTTKPNGIGMGLFYSKIIISRHKGNISINSKEGEGTEVMITLPICQN